jgi:hypothetical protein
VIEQFLVAKPLLICAPVSGPGPHWPRKTVKTLLWGADRPFRFYFIFFSLIYRRLFRDAVNMSHK